MALAFSAAVDVALCKGTLKHTRGGWCLRKAVRN